jgi:isoamyl acetate esterase
MTMQNVTLIGDSIRGGYQPVVAELLAGNANVWGPAQNGGDSANVRAHLLEWLGESAADVVHINCGLHDIKREFGAEANQVPLEAYKANVAWILTTLAEQTEARIIWAATTQVNHQWHHENKAMDRFEEDVVAYNAAALAIAQSLGLEVNDLFEVVMGAGRDQLLLPDGVHFKPQGYRLLAERVTEAV